jgi:hypothetical protein
MSRLPEVQVRGLGIIVLLLLIVAAIRLGARL